MANMFSMTPSEELEFQKQLEEDRRKFEALGLDYYTEFDYGNFTSFISASEHKAKSYGADYFVNEFINSESLANWKLHEALYTVGFVEYLCGKYDLELPAYVREYEGVKMPKLLFHESVYKALRNGMWGRGYDAYKNRLNFFAKHNLVFSHVDEVVKMRF